MKTIEETLFNFQLEKRMTQHDMADLLNVSQATYNNWINRKSEISPKYYPLIAKVCGFDTSPFSSNQMNNHSAENDRRESELKLYQKFTQNLEEQIAYLKDRAGELQSKLQEKEALLRNQQEEINHLRQQIL